MYTHANDPYVIVLQRSIDRRDFSSVIETEEITVRLIVHRSLTNRSRSSKTKVVLRFTTMPLLLVVLEHIFGVLVCALLHKMLHWKGDNYTWEANWKEKINFVADFFGFQENRVCKFVYAGVEFGDISPSECSSVQYQMLVDSNNSNGGNVTCLGHGELTGI